MKIVIAAAGLALMTSACATTAPKLASPGLVADKDTDLATTLVTHLLCEIKDARTFKAMAEREFIVVANLNVKAEVQSGAAPSADFIATIHDYKRHTLLGGELAQTNSVTLTEEVTFKLKDFADMGCGNYPNDLEGGSGAGAVQGRFGVKGLLERKSYPYLKTPKEMADLAKLPKPEQAAALQALTRTPGQAFGVLNPNVSKFGSAIEFTLKRSMTGGPHWELTHFVGPSASGVLSYQRTDVSTLTVAFATPPDDPDPSAVYIVPNPDQGAELVERGPGGRSAADTARRSARAADSARSLVQQMILQNLNLNRR